MRLETNSAIELQGQRAGFNGQARHKTSDRPGYFYHLERELRTAEEFRKNWLALNDLSLTGKQLANILHDTAAHLVPRSANPLEKDCLTILSGNMGVWEESMRDAPYGFNTNDKAISLWTCAAMSAVGYEGAFRPVAEKIYARLPACDSGLNDADKRQISQACLWFDFPQRYGEAPGREQTSASERRVADLFKAAQGNNVDLNYRLPGLHTIDIAIHDDNRDVLVEVDCHPSHFSGSAYNPETRQDEPLYSLGTLFQSALIGKFALNAVLLRMPGTTVNSILQHTPHTGALEADSLFRKARVREPGLGLKALFGNHPFVRPLFSAPVFAS